MKTKPLVILEERVDRAKNGSYKHLYECYCGNKFTALGSAVNSGNTKSCGCFKMYSVKVQNKTHGMSRSKTYNTWRGMWDRCHRSANNRWHLYGGRGIKMCKRWLIFDNFLFDMGERPAGTSIDRINVNGNYTLSNCRWATPKEQAINKRLK